MKTNVSNMVELDKQIFENPEKAYETINSIGFCERVVACLIEAGHPINFGDYTAKCNVYGHCTVLKKLGLYKTSGRGNNKTVFVDNMLLLIMKSTICSQKIVSKTIVGLMNGEYIGVKFGNIDVQPFLLMEIKITNNPIGGYNTYLFLNKDNGLVKIGRSKDVFKRLRSVCAEQKTNNIDLVAYKSADIEGALHIEHRFKRKHGEWFELSIDETLDIININSFNNKH